MMALERKKIVISKKNGTPDKVDYKKDLLRYGKLKEQIVAGG
jgi:hypothetical protein